MRPSDQVSRAILASLASNPAWHGHDAIVTAQLRALDGRRPALTPDQFQHQELRFGQFMRGSLGNPQEYRAIDIAELQVEIRKHIKEVRALRFDCVIPHPDDGHEVLIVLQGDDPTALPTDPNESYVQALRYIDAMLLLANKTPELQATLLPEIQKIITQFYTNWQIHGRQQVEATSELEAQCAALIKKNFTDERLGYDIKPHDFLTSLRDLTIQMQAPSEPMTVRVLASGEIEVQRTEPQKIAAGFYTDPQLLKMARQGGEIVSGGRSKLRDIFFESMPEPYTPSAAQAAMEPDQELAGDASSAKKDEKVRKVDHRTFWYRLYGVANPELALLSEHLVSAQPSSRYLPTPGNLRDIQRLRFTREGHLLESSHDLAMGTATSFLMQNETLEQKDAAVQQLGSVLDRNLPRDIDRFKQKYGGLFSTDGEIEFFVESKRLLSPVVAWDKLIPHVDNNLRFVRHDMLAMIKYRQYKEHAEHQIPGVRLTYGSSNLAVNYLTDKTVRGHDVIYSDQTILKDLLGDAAARPEYQALISPQTKLSFNARFFKRIADENQQVKGAPEQRLFFRTLESYCDNARFDPEIHGRLMSSQALAALERGALFPTDQVSLDTQFEIATRIKASLYLKRVLYDKTFFSPEQESKATDSSKKQNVERSFQNIIQVACEKLALGGQQTRIAGCKSARDRTAIVLAASLCLSRDFNLINNPEQLAREMIKELVRGHLMRNPDQVSVVKVSDVNSSWMRMLPAELQQDIKMLKRFIKSFKGEEVSVDEAHLEGEHQVKLEGNIDKMSAEFLISDPIKVYLNSLKQRQESAPLSEIEQQRLASLSEHYLARMTKKGWGSSVSPEEKMALALEFVVKANQVIPFIRDAGLSLPPLADWSALSTTRKDEGTETRQVNACYVAYEKAVQKVTEIAMKGVSNPEQQLLLQKELAGAKVDMIQCLVHLEEAINGWIAAKPKVIEFMQNYDGSLGSKRGAAVLLLQQLVQVELHKPENTDLLVAYSQEKVAKSLAELMRKLPQEQQRHLDILFPELKNWPTLSPEILMKLADALSQVARENKGDIKPQKLLISLANAVLTACPELAAGGVPPKALWDALQPPKLNVGKQTAKIKQAYDAYDFARAKGGPSESERVALKDAFEDWLSHKAKEKSSKRRDTVELFAEFMRHSDQERMPVRVMDVGHSAASTATASTAAATATFESQVGVRKRS